MTRKTHILHLINTFSVGGAENHLLSLVRGLSREKYDITVAFFKEEAQEARSLVPDFQALGVPVVDLQMSGPIDPAALVRLAALLRRERFDILHTHLFRADVLGAVIGRLMGVPIVLSSVHSRPPFFLRNPIKALLNRFSARLDDRVIVISDAIGRYLTQRINLDPQKMVRIHYGLERQDSHATAEPARVRRAFGLANEIPLIGTVARLEPEKGQDVLVRAMPRVLERVPAAHLLLIGHDWQGFRDELQALAEGLGVADYVTFAGFRSDVPRLLPGLDLFVVPSRAEGFGLVLLEAMQWDLPIVATTAGSIPEIVLDGETGRLVPPDAPAPLAEAIVELLADPERAAALGRAGGRRLREHFTWERMIRETEAVYDELVGDLL